MAHITIDNYNKVTGCISFTIVGTPIPTSITVQKSTNNGVTWTSDTGVITSPRCGYSYVYGVWFRLILQSEGVYSNIWKEDYTVTRTEIDTPEKLLFANSPIHFKIQNTAQDNTILSATLKCYVWSGNLNRTLGLPNFKLFKNQVSIQDNYIDFQLDGQLKSFINPKFAYNEMNLPAVANQGVFFQFEATIVSTTGTETIEIPTHYVTLGYRWNYEQSLLGNNGIIPNGSIGFGVISNKYYNHLVPNYIKQSFDFTKSISEATSSNIILTQIDTPEDNLLKCSRDPYVIVYLDKLGLWQMFTPFGKTIVATKVNTEFNNRAFRDSSNVDNRYQHHKGRTKIETPQSYSVNTGALNESMAQLVEEILYSEKVYLINFKGDLQTTTTIGLTIDNTYVSIDDETITIDNETVTEEFLDFYKTFRQIPVIATGNDFTRKTRINDKNDINYLIKFDETNNKIL